MKILKKLLVIGFFSFLFLIGNVHALTNFNNSDINTISNYLNNYGTYEDLKNMILNHIDVNNFITKDKYIVYIDKSPNDTANKYFNVYFFQFNDSDNVHFALNYISYSYYALYFRTSSSNEQFDYFDAVATFNNDYTDITFSKTIDSTKWTTSSNFWSLGSNSSSTTFHIVPIFSNVESLPYEQPTWSTEPFSFNNSQDIYRINDEVPLSALKNNNFPFEITDIYGKPENPNMCFLSRVIGSTQNISSLNFRVQGTTNALDFPIEGYFDIKSDSFDSFNTNWISHIYASAESFGQLTEGQYDIDYNITFDNETNILRLYYVITAEDDTDTNVDVIFTLSYNDDSFKPFFTNELKIFACPPFDNYSNISYGYKDSITGQNITTDTSFLNMLNNQSNPDLGMFTNIRSLLPEGPIDSILTIPLKVINSLISALSGNCQSINLRFPFVNTNLELKCMNYYYDQMNAISIFNAAGVVASTIMLMNYFTFLYNWLDDIFRFSHKKVKTWGTGEV